MVNLKINGKIKKYVLKLINDLNYSIDNFIDDLSKLEPETENILKEFVKDNPNIFSDFNSEKLEDDFEKYVNYNFRKFGILDQEINHHAQFIKMSNITVNTQKMMGNLEATKKINEINSSESIGKISKPIPPINILKPYDRILNQYRCKGKFIFENEKILDLNFKLIQFVNGEIKIKAEPTHESFIIIDEIFKNKIIYCSVEGDLIENYGKISIKNVAPIKNGEFIEFNVYSNVHITFKDEFNHIKYGLRNFLNEYDFEFQLNENLSVKVNMAKNINEIKKLFENKLIYNNITSEIIVYSNVDVFDEIEKLTYLLSYANRTKIDFIYEKFYYEDQLSKIKLIPSISFNYKNNHRLIEPENLKYYLEKTYDKFSHYYPIFSLNIFIDMLINGLNTIYSEIGYVLLEISLETFLSEWEEYCRENDNPIEISLIKQNKHELVKFLDKHKCDIEDSEINKFIKKISMKHTGVYDKFDNLIENELFKDKLEVSDDDRIFANLRNKIAHTGKVPDILNTATGEKEINLGIEFERLVYLIDRIILILIEYDKEFNKLHGDIEKL